MALIITIFFYILYYYRFIILFYVLTSWFPSIRSSGVGKFLASLSEPYLSIFRKVIPSFGMIDFSPIIAFLVLGWAMDGLIRFL